MKLLTKEIERELPALYAQDGLGEDAIVHVKFFTPDAQWTWFITEGSPILNAEGEVVDWEFFGLAHGFEAELGYVYLSQLQSARGGLGLPIERDRHWTPKTLREAKLEAGIPVREEV